MYFAAGRISELWPPAIAEETRVLVKPNRKKVVLLLLLVGLAAAGAGWLAMWETADRETAQPPSVAAAVNAPAACAEFLAPGRAFTNYEIVRKKLAAGAVDQEILDKVACLIEDDATGFSSEQLYNRLLTMGFMPNVFYDFLTYDMSNTISQAQKNPVRRSRWLAWQGSYAAEGALMAYRRTGDARFLQLFSDYFEQVLKLRDSQLGLTDQVHGRVMPAWGDGDEIEGKWIAHVTQAARITFPGTEFARIVRSDPALARFAPMADRYVAAAVEAMAAFEEDYRPIPGEGLSYFIRPGKNREEPINHAHQVGRVYLNLYELTGNEEYLRKSKEILAVFVKSIRYGQDNKIVWSYFAYFSKEKENIQEISEDTWKASLTAPFIYMAHERGLGVSQQLVASMADTFLANVLANNELGRDLGGETKVAKGDERRVQAFGFVSWLDYSPLRPEIATRTREIVATRRDLFPKGWFDSANLARGYAFFLPQTAPPGAVVPANDGKASR
jgi:hypothetical protein